ncbi:YSIRK-type signal peptide-containing protein [Streptococcus mitis]|uniref:YSIRK signal domain/LPXTG anchor domain surface protein n=5 Tax=Streptococcus mitis group TaxID=3409772 RepID=A0A1X1JIA2_STRMT|nr:YSIRK-type signal peptide-containing protein [Streptococcus mitis]ORO86842.1 YSIRK signal domain/LPXTG anchor domain surface protein [Streptococcus mitis]
MKGKQQQDFRVEKYIRYGIRKYSFGAASVAIAAGLMFLGNGAVSASETAVNGNGSDVAVVSANTEDNQDKVVTPVVDNKEVKEEAKPEVATPAVTPKVEESKKEEAQKTEEVTKEEAAPKLDKSQLESYVNEVAGKLAAGKYANKTDESLALLNADLEAAKTALSNATSQDELKAAYNKLVTTVNSKLKNKPVEKKETLAVDTTNGKETVGKKAENTEKKSESNAIENTGSKDERNGKELVEGSNLRSANEGYTLASTELRKENGEFATATGKTYKELDSNAAYRIYVKGFQSENTEEVAKNNPQPGTGARTDLPLSKTEAQKLGREAAMWNNKLRASGQNNNTNPYGSGGAYEYLATEIYGYTYEQGNHYVYLKDVTKRFELNDAAKAAGYTIKKVTPMNLPPGLGYNANSDTVEGYIGANIQNGVYDFRYELTVAKGDTEQKVYFRDLQAGWIGWQDSTAPRIQGVSTMVTIGEDVSHSLQYVDNDGVNRDTRANYQREDGSKFVAGSKTAPSSTAKKAEFVAADGTTVKSMNSPQTVTAYTTLNGKTLGKNGEKPVSLDDTIPGLTYAPETGLITGKPTEAGIFTVAAMAKDYNSASAWNMNGQEAHENITIAVAPKITVKNVEAYATSVPVTISNGANKAEITMPDGTVTKLVAKDGNWTVAAGTTNTAVQEGAVLGAVAASGESTINLTVTPESTKYVGVDSIAAKATTDKVQAHLQRETVTVKDHNNKEYTATFNRATGKYTLPNEDAYQLEESGDNSILTERRVYTEAQANGDVKLFVYEFTRTWNAKSTATSLADKIAEIRTNGEVTAVGDVFRTETLLPNDQTSSTQGRTIKVSYDSASDQWSASDGSTVTATKSNAGWKVSTTSGFSGYIAYREAVGTDLASIQNDKPTGTSTSYSETKGTSVDLIKSTKANVAFTDTIDDKTSATDSDTIKTKVTATAPDGTVTTFDGAQAEETAYIQAQRTAAVKTKAAAQAVKDKQDAQNDLASLQERLDRQTRAVEDAQVALDNLKLRTISPTAQQMAQKTLEIAKEIKAKLEADIEAAKGTVTTRDTAVNTSRQEALEAEKAVETARAALKTAAEANLAKANAYVLSQKGRYKVTARAVDSNGVVTTPTVDGTDAGEVTEDAVAETTYYIVVTEPEKSSGAQGQKQTDSMADNFNDGKEGTTVSDYKLVDPTTGNKVSSVTTDQGTYTVDPTTGEVTFTPVEGFVGTATPMKVSANVTFNDESGNPVTVATENTYTPTVYGVQPSTDKTTGKQGQTQTSKSGKDRFSELNTATNTPDGTNVDWSTAAYSLEGANEKDEVEVEGEGTYSIDPTTGVVTFKPLPTFKGEGKGVNVQVSVTATDSEGNKVPVTSKGKYTPEVTPVTPTGEDVTSTGKQGQEQTGTPKFTQGDETAPITINEKQPAKFVVNGQPVESTEISATKDGKEVGKYVIDPLTGVVTFKPNKDFIGTPDPATVEVKDKNGTPATATYTPTVTPVVPTAEPKETTGKQDQPQTQETESMFKQGDEVAPIDKTTVKLVDPSGNEVTTMPALKDGKEVGTYTIDPTTGVITFQPNKDFTGTPDPAKVVAKDTNGTKVETTYTPTVTPVVPTAEPKETTGKQGQPQTQETESMFKQGDEVAPIDKTTVKLVDPSGNEVTTMPAMKDGKEVGTYTIDPATGVITFQPNKDFVGTPDPAKVVAKDTNGTKVETTYTPTVTPVTPTADPAETTDIQGKEQNGKPTFTPGNPDVPMDNEVPATFEDGSTEKVIPGEGTYTVAPDGTVTFTPEKTFTGKGTGVTVKRVDKNGTPVTAKYTPNVTPVTPTADPAETTDIQGKEQNGKPTFTPGNPDVPMDNEVPATFEDGSTEKVIPGEGTYTVAPDGTVTFTPEKTFTGKGTGVTVKRVDKNGTPVTAKYTPNVTPVTPTADPAETTDIQGKEQNGKPTFTPGNPDVPMDDEVPATFEDGSTTKTIPGEGTYTVAPDGTVTFTPEKTFTGVGTGVTVKRVDKNGTPVTAKYTPTVTPVTPVGTPAESEGPKGQQQTGTPVFTPGNPNVPIDEDVPPTFEDGTTTKVVPGEGTYTIDKDGKVTFTPEKDFVGKAKGVTVKRVDKNGTPVTATYTPTVRPDTKFVVVGKDGKEVELVPSKDGKTPAEVIPGYKVVKTEVDEKGNTKHIYEKVTTTYKDKDGNVIPGTTTEEGTTPKKDIPGYRFVETKTLPNGDTEHIYEKVKTSFKDKDGNEIPGYPTEDGEQPKKDIPGYRFVETKKLPNGDTEHVYEKVKTSFKDKDGNEIPNYPTEDGEQPKKDIPGYRFVDTKKLPNGDIEHVYEKVSTPLIPQPNPGKQITTTWTDENGNPLKPTEPGSKEPGTIPGYEYVKTVTDPNGNIRHIFKKVEMPTPVEPSQPVQPVSPQEPTSPEKPVTPDMPAVPEQPKQPATPKYVEGQKELPNTGTEDNASLAALGLLGVLSGFGLVARKKKED